MASEALPYARSILYGLRDSFLGIIAFFKPIYQTSGLEADNVPGTAAASEQNRTKRRSKQTTPSTRKKQSYKEIYSMMVQCCILNGGIFWMSILLFENYLIPVLQHLTFFIFKSITGSETAQSLMWGWMAPTLSYIFRAFWVIPLFWITKPLNNLWYQEIADLAYRRRSGKPTVLLSSGGSLAQNLSLTIADIFFSLLIQGFFLLQATLVSIVPIVGPVLSLLHMTLLHSLYCFEYTWVNKGWRVDKRLSYIECNWPYFVGFGLPLAVLTNINPSFVVSGCIFAILFPLFIVSASEAQPVEIKNVPVRIFSFSVWLTNKVFRHSWSRTTKQPSQ